MGTDGARGQDRAAGRSRERWGAGGREVAGAWRVGVPGGQPDRGLLFAETESTQFVGWAAVSAAAAPAPVKVRVLDAPAGRPGVHPSAGGT